MKLPIKRLLALMTLGAALAMTANESHAQTGGDSLAGQFNNAGASNQGNSNLFRAPTGGPGSQAANPSINAQAPAPAAAAATPAPAAAAAPAAVTTTTNVTNAGGTAVAGVAAGLSTVNPVTILGNGFGGFPTGFNPSQPNQPMCRNVIDLLVRHCIGNRLFGANGQPGMPGFVGGGFVPGMFPPFFPGQVLGDLELVAVNVVTDGAPNVGPVYQVTFRNNSQFALQNFQISLVAVLGVINDFSPNVSVNVPLVNAGETASVQIQLPATVMAMGVPTQPLVPFDTLVVALDSFDNVIERNELNNIATLKRVGIPIFVATPPASQTTTTTAVVSGVQAAPVAPAPGGSTAAPAPAPTPSDSVVPMPNDKINLDTLDLGDTNAVAKQAKP